MEACHEVSELSQKFPCREYDALSASNSEGEEMGVVNGDGLNDDVKNLKLLAALLRDCLVLNNVDNEEGKLPLTMLYPRPGSP